MKRILMKMVTLSAALMLIAAPVRAGELSAEPASRPDAAPIPGKDVCLLVAMNCNDRLESSQHRIDMIQREINKGNAVYTDDELKALQRKLDFERNEMMKDYEGGA